MLEQQLKKTGLSDQRWCDETNELCASSVAFSNVKATPIRRLWQERGGAHKLIYKHKRGNEITSQMRRTDSRKTDERWNRRIERHNRWLNGNSTHWQTSSEQRLSHSERPVRGDCQIWGRHIYSPTLPGWFCILTWGGFNFHMRVGSSSCARCVLKQEKSLTFTSFQCQDLCDKQNSRYRSERKKKTARKSTCRRTVCGLQFRLDLCSLTAVWVGKELIRKQLELRSPTGRFYLCAGSQRNGRKGMVRRQEKERCGWHTRWKST